MRHILSASILAPLLVVVSFQNVYAADDKPNAADLYKQAFQKVRDLPADVTDALLENDGRIDKAITPTQQRLLDVTAEASALVAKAMAIEACDWKYPAGEIWDVPGFDDLSISRRLARMSVLRSAHLLAQKKEKEAADELIAAWTMGRRVSLVGTRIAVLIQISIDSLFLDACARLMPQFSKEGRAHFSARLAKLPTAVSSKAADANEDAAFAAYLRGGFLKDPAQNIRILTDLAEFTHSYWSQVKEARGEKADEFDHKSIESIATIAAKDLPRFKKLVDEMEASTAAYRKVYDLPVTEHEAFIKKWSAGLDLKNPLIKHFVAREEEYARAETAARMDSMNAMLRAGLAYFDEGDAALAKIVEPGTKQRFDVEKTESGFIVRSRTMKLRGESVHVRFGAEPAAPF